MNLFDIAAGHHSGMENRLKILAVLYPLQWPATHVCYMDENLLLPISLDCTLKGYSPFCQFPLFKLPRQNLMELVKPFQIRGGCGKGSCKIGVFKFLLSSYLVSSRPFSAS